MKILLLFIIIIFILDLEKRENAAQQEKESDADANEKLAAQVCFLFVFFLPPKLAAIEKYSNQAGYLATKLP